MSMKWLKVVPDSAPRLCGLRHHTHRSRGHTHRDGPQPRRSVPGTQHRQSAEGFYILYSDTRPGETVKLTSRARVDVGLSELVEPGPGHDAVELRNALLLHPDATL